MRMLSKIPFLLLTSVIFITIAVAYAIPGFFLNQENTSNLSSQILGRFNLFNSQDRIRIGEHEIISVYIHYLDPIGSQRIIEHPNAAFIKLHFAHLNLLPGDYITVSDPEHLQVYTYPDGSDFTTDGETGFWALTIFADMVEIELHSSYFDRELSNRELDQYGVYIDKYARGYSMFEIQDFSYLPESVCGRDERLDAACYQDSHPVEYSRSNAVAMHVYNGVGWCSAWRVGPGNFVFTNEHCLTDQAELNASEFWFGHQRLGCGTGVPQIPTIVTGEDFIQDDFLTDFALVTINDEQLIREFGWLEIDERLPVSSEEIYIPQQPGGLSPNDQRKVIAVGSDMDSGNVCRIDQELVDGRWRNTDTSYMCDTSPGASGSPVLARSSHAVIGLHHLGGCRNKAVRMDKIWPLVYQNLVPAPDLIALSAPKQVEAGETFRVAVQAQNDNGPAPEGLIHVSIGYSDDTNDLEISGISSSGAGETLVLEPGQGPLMDNQCNEIPGGASNFIIQLVDNDWENGELHMLAFDITPNQPGLLWLRVRNSMKDVRTGCHYYNDADLLDNSGFPDIDQGGWEATRFEVEVTPKVQVGPLSIDKIRIDDDRDGGSAGNNNGVIECGEVVELEVGLFNHGSVLLKGVNANLIGSGDGLSIMRDLGKYDDVPPQTASSSSAVIEFVENLPPLNSFQLKLETTAANGGPWDESLELTAVCQGSTVSDDLLNLYFPSVNTGN